MPTYTFHHYGHEPAPSGISFSECEHDEAALVEARRLLDWHGLSRLEVCEFRREVGSVHRDDAQAPARIEPQERSSPRA